MGMFLKAIQGVDLSGDSKGIIYDIIEFDSKVSNKTILGQIDRWRSSSINSNNHLDDHNIWHDLTNLYTTKFPISMSSSEFLYKILDQYDIEDNHENGEYCGCGRILQCGDTIFMPKMVEI